MSDLRIDINLPGAAAEDESHWQHWLEGAVRSTLEHEGVQQAAVSVTLVDDAEIARLNAHYLQHEGPTDVLSFPLFEKDEAPVGDIYIGFDQARRQSEELQIPLDTELARLAIHGTLHVLGYTHPDLDARERSDLWQRQEAILQKVLRR
ncbi:MAG: rRNA maturation RNase YbeY [Longimicrobiales bacterium]